MFPLSLDKELALCKLACKRAALSSCVNVNEYSFTFGECRS